MNRYPLLTVNCEHGDPTVSQTRFGAVKRTNTNMSVWHVPVNYRYGMAGSIDSIVISQARNATQQVLSYVCSERTQGSQATAVQNCLLW